MSVVCGLLAGKGVFDMAQEVIFRCVQDPLVDLVVVLTPKDRVKKKNILNHPKICHINEWIGEDSHNKTGINREEIRQKILFYLTMKSDIKWIWIGDEDAMPYPNYFRILSDMHCPWPVLLTGKTLNMDGTRWYDICSFQTDAHPFCVPYDDWQNKRWNKDLYASGNQHVFNRIGFDLNVPYPDTQGEDPHFCWAFRKAGGILMFIPELVMKLQKQHPPANYGYEPCLPR